jgi:hypothetical protein
MRLKVRNIVKSQNMGKTFFLLRTRATEKKSF